MERLLELGPENITVHTLSVKRSADLSGERAVDLLSDRIFTKRELPMQITLPAKLMIRESVRCLDGEEK